MGKTTSTLNRVEVVFISGVVVSIQLLSCQIREAALNYINKIKIQYNLVIFVIYLHNSYIEILITDSTNRFI